MAGICYRLAQTQNWRTTTRCLFATAFSIYQQLSSTYDDLMKLHFVMTGIHLQRAGTCESGNEL